jgi:hypothetical protein
VKKLLLVAAILLMAACSPSTLLGGSKVNDTCANKVALSIVSSTPVTGAFACLGAVDQKILKTGAPVISNDTDLSTHNITMTYQGQTVPLSITSCGGMKTSKDVTKNQESYEIYPTDPTLATQLEHAVLKVYINKRDSKVTIFYFNHPETCLTAQDAPSAITL